MNAIINKTTPSGISFKIQLDIGVDYEGTYFITTVTKSLYDSTYLLVQRKNTTLDMLLVPCISLPGSKRSIRFEIYSNSGDYFDFVNIYGYTDTSTGEWFVALEGGNNSISWSDYFKQIALVNL